MSAITDIQKAYIDAACFTEECSEVADDFNRHVEATMRELSEKHTRLIELTLNYANGEQIGHDLWLTRNGHGAGFWDRNFYPKELKDLWCEIARKMGEVYVSNENGVLTML